MSTIDQKEYLKRYLSNGDGEEKKKKKRKKPTGNPTAAKPKAPRSAFIDDDVDIRGLAKLATEDEPRLLHDADEAPLVAAFIDERPEEEVQLENYRSSNKWKSLVQDMDEQSISGNNTDGMAFLRRKKRHDFSPDISPLRRQRHDSDSDLSPPRGRLGHPQKKGRHDSDSDLSPIRENCEARQLKRRHESNSDSSSRRRLKGKSSRERIVTSQQDSDSDLSPARARAYSPSHRNLERLGPRHDSDSDLSPPRGAEGERAMSSDCDLRSSREQAHRGTSSHHKHRQDSDPGMLPLRKQERSGRRGQRKRMDSNSDLSPDRGKKDQSGDRDKMKPTKTLSGAKAGLSDAAALRRENEASRRRTDEAYSKLTDDVSGKNAETIFRDKSGRKRDLKAERRFKREQEKRRAEEDEKFMQWGKGLAQIKNQKDQVEDMVKEMAKPLARYKDDADLDEMLKEQDREGDPMLAFLKKKESKARAKAGIKEKPKYRGPKPAPNRFGIQPGYRWDGVDRSNGFEKKYFQRQSDKRATSEMAYKWSVEDM